MHVNEELVHADLRHLRLGALVGELLGEELAEGLGCGGIASAKGQTIKLAGNSDKLCHPFTATVNELSQTRHRLDQIYHLILLREHALTRDNGEVNLIYLC